MSCSSFSFPALRVARRMRRSAAKRCLLHAIELDDASDREIEK
jgi:hypothetical protein